MSPKSKDIQEDEMLPEYDFDPSEGVRGKYYKRLVDAGYTLVMLEPDVSSVFTDNAAVNVALRQVIALGELTRQNGLAAKPKKTAKAAKKSPRFATTKNG